MGGKMHDSGLINWYQFWGYTKDGEMLTYRHAILYCAYTTVKEELEYVTLIWAVWRYLFKTVVNAILTSNSVIFDILISKSADLLALSQYFTIQFDNHFTYANGNQESKFAIWLILNRMCVAVIACPAPVNLPKASLGKQVINECFDLWEIKMSWEFLVY